jgi:DNA-binding MarR family transcriptional regulator
MKEERKVSQANRTIPFKTIFRLAAAQASGEVRLSSQEWSILAHVNGVRTVAEIARRLRLNDLEVAEILFRLSSAGLR